ncbi:MAG: DUF3421 domain-containing protein [Candidatus Latescibacteria bacterium]|nr:DUF3421 domain-containing protein [Candidatus Latescibacterota bacterium]
MTRQSEYAPPLFRCSRILALALVLTLTSLAGAQSDPNTWPATFNGAPDMGPYAWVDGPTHLQKDPQLASGVFVGQEGTNRMFVCRAKMADGVHPGKFFNGMCNVGWGGVEKVHTSGYELLVNTQPQNAKFLPQTWVSPATAASATFTGGSAGTTAMRVARASYNNGVHPGKEWAGKCNIGWGGKEVAVTPYEVLSLGFDKAAWQASQAPQTQTFTTPLAPPPPQPKGTTAPSARETDPVISYSFSVVIAGGVNASGYFTAVSGLQGENDVVTHRVVSPDGKEFVQIIPGRVKWGEVTLKKGVTTDMGFWKWRELVILGKIDDARANMTITMYDRNYTPVMNWTFRNAWPSRLSGPSMDSGSSDFSVEEMTIIHEGMTREGQEGYPIPR